jgi:hypothetical protein
VDDGGSDSIALIGGMKRSRFPLQSFVAAFFAFTTRPGCAAAGAFALQYAVADR